MNKNADAFRTISEVADELDLPQHVLRFWETRFPQIKPLKRAGGRRYYRPRDIEVLRAIKHLLYQEGYTIRGVQRVLKDQMAGAVAAMTEAADGESSDPGARQSLFPPDLLRDESEGDAEDGSRKDHAAAVPSPAEFPGLPDRDDFMLASALTPEEIGRLRAALAELVECETILEAARRR
jgi:DNA-binding transcriptional MerR regulator